MPVFELAIKKKKRPSATAETKEAKESKSSEKTLPPTEGVTTVEFNEPAQWVERMALTATRPLPADLHADDDPRREEAFIQQALLSVTRGLALLEKAGVPWRRPADYYAEMLKDDVHMSRIAGAMDASRARIEARAQRRAMKDQKKYGKEVQAEVLRQRAKYKRDMGERISDWRRKRKGNEDLRDILEEGGDADGPAAKRQRTERAPRQRNLRPGGGGGGSGGAKKRPGKNARKRR